MAKVKLSAMFVTSVQGHADNTSWKTHDREHVLVKQKQVPGRFKKPFRSHRLNPELISPPTLYADCDAWKAADLAYTSLPPEIKGIWRASIQRPGFSTYDVYMKQAIPNLLRGYPAPDLPPGTTGWRLKKLSFSELYIHGHEQPGCTALPPVSCQTQGLHFLGVDWRRVTISAPGAMEPAWGVRLLWGFNDGHPERPDAFNYVLEVMSGTAPDDQHYYFSMVASGEALPTVFVPFRPAYISFSCYPVQRFEPGDHVKEKWIETENGLILWPLPDESRLVTVKFLNNEENFVHWPRWWPSRKRSAIPLTLPLLHVFSDDEILHWWPKGS